MTQPVKTMTGKLKVFISQTAAESNQQTQTQVKVAAS